YTEVGLTATTSYQVQAYCDGALAGTSSPVTVTVNNPQLLSTMGATRCGDGTVDLQATADAGYVVNWYDVPTGGSPIATGNVFTTPVISTTTDFYVSASTGGSGSIYVGPVDPASVGTSSGTTAPITTYHMAFDVLVPTTIVSIDVYPTASVGSTGGIEIRDNADNIIANIPYVTTVTGGSTPQTIMLNVTLPPGTGYKMGQNPAIALIRNSAGASYPYTSPAINIVSNNFGATYYYYFYNWQVSTGCESPRVPVTAVVNPADPVTVGISPNDTICNGVTATLMTSSSNPTYMYNWTDDQGNPVGSGTSVNITPVANTTYYLSAVDANS